MNRSFKIKEYIKSDGGANIYSVIYDDQTECETELMLDKFYLEHKKSVQSLDAKLLDLSKYGATQFNLKHQHKNIYRLESRGQIKLYCIKLNDLLLVCGGCAVKNQDGSWQEDSSVKPVVDELIAINEIIDQKISDGDIRINSNKLDGDLVI